MKKFFSILCVFLFVICCAPLFGGCGGNSPKRDFRVVAYIRAEDAMNSNFDKSHISQATDIILFETAIFNEYGMIFRDERFDDVLNNVRSAMNQKQKLYVNLLGPDGTSENEETRKQEQAVFHNMAFENGLLEGNIEELLSTYQFDGVCFDYEFPLTDEDWQIYNTFLVSLAGVLGEEYDIGVAFSYWDSKYSEEAMEAVDLFALMSYDNFDEEDNNKHSTLADAKKDVERVLEKGFEKEKLVLGVPFYARPTTGERYWYSYKDYYDKIDEEGLYNDPETGLTFSFNTYDVIYQKTKYAIEQNLAGVMIWHYGCDLPATDNHSLFNAITKSIQDNL